MPSFVLCGGNVYQYFSCKERFNKKEKKEMMFVLG